MNKLLKYPIYIVSSLYILTLCDIGVNYISTIRFPSLSLDLKLPSIPRFPLIDQGNSERLARISKMYSEE